MFVLLHFSGLFSMPFSLFHLQHGKLLSTAFMEPLYSEAYINLQTETSSWAQLPIRALT